MNYWELLLVGAGGLAGYIGKILVARYSKSRAERDVGLAKEYLSLAGITADELEKRINLISKLDSDIRKLENENHRMEGEVNDMKKKRAERDLQMISLESNVVSLQAQIDKDSHERNDLRAKLADIDFRYRVLWRYLIVLLEQLRHHKIVPAEPPEELKNDPEIERIWGDIKSEGW